MIIRFRRAWRAYWLSHSSVVAEQTSACATCADLRRQVEYWRSREERMTDALLAVKGVAPAAVSRPTAAASAAGLFSKALGVHTIDSTRTSPGQGEMT